MCGIAGIISLHENNALFEKFPIALNKLAKRGPDSSGIYINNGVALGHRRLSIIDTSDAGSQPMTDSSDRYTIVFNGEFFNYRDFIEELKSDGIHLKSHSDTEVLLYLYIKYGIKCINKINGFFAFCIYDKDEETVFIARDRFGIKPLVYAFHNDSICFSSEIKTLLALGVKKSIDTASLELYFQLNYLPGEYSMLEGIKRLLPGNQLLIDLKKEKNLSEITPESWYQIPYSSTGLIRSASEAGKGLYKRLDDAVSRRLISDVPLGCFLSGGVDSTIITALASLHTEHLKTFSIGFSDDPQFDETVHAEVVANHFKTDHQTFHLKSHDLLDALPEILNYLDEPFADSSSLAVFILSRECRKHVTVALSGDGADELFSGYRKHRAEWMMVQKSIQTRIVKAAAPALKNFHGSRQSAIGNKLRQLQRFAEGASMSPQERYWRWCSISKIEDVKRLLKSTHERETKRRTMLLTSDVNESDLNAMLLNDCKLVLPFDMLVKVDQMSMANSLEVRVPFLDYEVVEWAFKMPVEMKINKHEQKKILKDTFKHLLPKKFFERKKQGFEVPILAWLKTDLSPLLDQLFNQQFIEEQNIFNYNEIATIRKKLFSSHPGDATGKIWALLVFQYWFRNVYQN
jgi:asparagine synthase (glutamine-hydrolysing)